MSISVSLHSGTVEALRSKVGKRGFFAYVEAAVQRQIALDNLAEIVADHESKHGAFTEEELSAAEARLFGDRPA